jgi:hypothetical protein
MFACFAKNPAFSEEREWRIVLGKVSAFELQFRINKSILVPYIPVQIDPGGAVHPLLMGSIIVGPSPNQELLKGAIQKLLVTLPGFWTQRPDYKNLKWLGEVSSSAVPYRNW